MQRGQPGQPVLDRVIAVEASLQPRAFRATSGYTSSSHSCPPAGYGRCPTPCRRRVAQRGGVLHPVEELGQLAEGDRVRLIVVPDAFPGGDHLGQRRFGRADLLEVGHGKVVHGRRIRRLGGLPADRLGRELAAEPEGSAVGKRVPARSGAVMQRQLVRGPHRLGRFSAFGPALVCRHQDPRGQQRVEHGPGRVQIEAPEAGQFGDGAAGRGRGHQQARDPRVLDGHRDRRERRLGDEGAIGGKRREPGQLDRTPAACQVRWGALPEPRATGITSSSGRSPTCSRLLSHECSSSRRSSSWPCMMPRSPSLAAIARQSSDSSVHCPTSRSSMARRPTVGAAIRPSKRCCRSTIEPSSWLTRVASGRSWYSSRKTRSPAACCGPRHSRRLGPCSLPSEEDAAGKHPGTISITASRLVAPLRPTIARNGARMAVDRYIVLCQRHLKASDILKPRPTRPPH